MYYPINPKIANIPTIKIFIQNSLIKAYNSNHSNPVVRNTGNYETTNIPLKIRTSEARINVIDKLHIKITLKHSRFSETFFLQPAHTCITHKQINKT